MSSVPLPPDPLIARLRPRSVPELLDRSFRVYRRHFLTFLAIIAIIHVPLQLLIQIINITMLGEYTSELVALEGSSLSSSSTTSAIFPTAGLWYIVILALSLAYWLLQSLSQGALTAAIANSYMDRPVSFGQAYQSMLKQIGPLLGAIGLQVLIGIAIFAPFIILLLISMASLLASAVTSTGGSSNVYSGTLGLGLMCIAFMLIIPTGVLAIYVFVRLSVMVPALMVEGMGPVQALKRSWALINNSWWRTAGLLLLLGLLNYVISAGPAYFITGIIGLFMRNVDPVTLNAVTSSVGVFTSLIYIPIELAAITLYYFDLRVRKEGFDLEAAIDRQFGPLPTPTVQAQWQSEWQYRG